MSLEKEFELFLRKKRINTENFKKEEPQRWEEFLRLFSQVHPNSFVAQKLYLINQLRRKYHLKEP
ncbi:MAG: hypothetical protein NZ521_04335 [Flammeovirgaceae bacterium]|nr:hypothetical protein [Flammeovirgaceae bacterium]MDW8287125.1 hypothetical protein [Flammeovirgaceae bacterium]